jgi:cytochrome d ubiquinol oxidase subunit I
VQDPLSATEADIQDAAYGTIPHVPTLFWSFRVMVGLGFYFIALFDIGFYYASKRQLLEKRWFQKVALWTLPLPWVAAELGWIVAEVGRQPRTIDGVLPTFLSASSVSSGQVWFSLAGFVWFYTTLLIVDIKLMLKYIRLGP